MIVESEPAEGLSTHKLLIETAKHNVLTAYSGREGLEMLQRYPDVDAIVFDTALEDLTCEQFTREVQKQNSRCKIIGLKHRDRAPGKSQVRVQRDLAAMRALIRQLYTHVRGGNVPCDANPGAEAGWLDLCAQAQSEQDVSKLIKLVTEINRLLREDQDRKRTR